MTMYNCLMMVYNFIMHLHAFIDGALLWSMGKIFRGAEVTRIYVGSYSDEEIKHKEQFGSLFEKDHDALLAQLNELPGMCCMRKVSIYQNVMTYCICCWFCSILPLSNYV